MAEGWAEFNKSVEEVFGKGGSDERARRGEAKVKVCHDAEVVVVVVVVVVSSSRGECR